MPARRRHSIADCAPQWQGPPAGLDEALAFSAGFSCVGDAQTGLDSVLRRADAALYRAEAGGRGRLALDDTTDAP